MAATQSDVEAIVREVIRRLSEPAGNPPPRAATTAAAITDDITIGDRVVTLASLPTNWHRAKRLVVKASAVVTPAVRDQLRERGIELSRANWVGEATNGSPTPDETQTLLAIVTDIGDSQRLMKWCAAEHQQVKPLEAQDLFRAVAVIGDAIVAGPTRGVLLTDQPSAAVCLANRRAGVRASLASSVVSVDDAIRSIAANLLVIDTRRHGAQEVRNMVRRFVQAGYRDCPEMYRTRL
jgi:ribose 5-phosphate isomerase RpiB